MSRYVWVVETNGETESQEIYGTRKRAIDSMVGTEVFDESKRELVDGDDDRAVVEVDAGGSAVPESEPEYSEPMCELTRREIGRLLLANAGEFAHWPMDGAGNTFLSIARRRVR